MGRFLHSKHFDDIVVKRNFYLNLFDGALFSLAMSFVSLQTVFPVLIKKISGSDFAIGLIPVIWAGGFNFPQILIANYVRKIGYKKSFMLKTALGQRLPWLFIAVLVYFFIERLNPNIASVLILSSLGFAAIGGSLNLPGWFDLISKLTHVNLRGRLFAYRSVVGAILGVIGGTIVIIILNTFPYPKNFGILFFLTFIVMMMSYVFLLFLKEETPNPSPLLFGHKEYVKRLFSILKKEKNFRNFLVSDSLMILANICSAFFAVYAIEKFSLADSYAGTFTIVMMISMIIGSIYFGYIADRYGHKINLVWASAFTGIACLIALVSPIVELFYFVFVGSALNLSLQMVSRLTIVAEICSEEDRPTYVALTNLVTAPFVLSGIFGGIIVHNFGFETLFIVSFLFSLSTFLWLLFKVDEPRKFSFMAQSK